MTYDQGQWLDKLHRTHYERLRAYAYRRLGDYELAEDIVQRAFLLACGKIESLVGHDNPIGWFYKVIRYLTEHELSRAYHELEVCEDNMDQYIGGVDMTDGAWLPPALNAQDREILLLTFEMRLTHAEIAERLGISQAASRKRLSRALRNCRDIWTK